MVEREAGWQLYPIGGDTGKAYMGTKDQEKVFLKRNSSPFLAALSLEEITPKLIWTKRAENGDVLTAQEWCNGRTLSETEMKTQQVGDILSRVHQSQTLRRMLERVGGKTVYASHLLEDLYFNLTPDLQVHPTITQVFNVLIEQLDHVEDTRQIRVAHGDISHNNLLLSDTGKLYLVDWDNAILADPANDLGQLFARYIDINDWEQWYDSHLLPVDQFMQNKIRWYAFLHLLLEIKTAYYKKRYNRLNYLILKLDRWQKTVAKKETIADGD